MAREFRVYGPPGTGKTTYIGAQAKKAAEKYGASGIVIASLTKAAAAEIGSRLDDIPRENVGTLHAHAWRALGRPKIAESNDGLKLWNESRKSREDRIEGKAALNPENAPLEATLPTTEAESLLGEVAVYRARMTPVELWPIRVRRFYEKWEAFKITSGMIDYTDLIERAFEEIDEHPAKPAAFFLDEAQDMSKLEMRLARKWGGECAVFVIVGDPYQNLYQWRGSDPEAFTGGEVEGVKILDQSWRVPRVPQEYAVRFVKSGIPGDFPEYKPRAGAEGSLSFLPFSWSYPEPFLNKLIEDDSESVMVLASCAYMLNPLVAALRERGIPFHNPYRIEHGGWNPLRYATRVRSFLAPTLENRMWSYRDLYAFVEPLKAKGNLVHGAKSQIELMNEKDRFKSDEQADIVPSLKRLRTLFTEEALERMIEQDLDWLIGAALASRSSVIEYSATVAKNDPSLLGKTPKIIVGTIHSVKGGEADSVYVFPDLSRRGFKEWERRGGGRDAIYRQFYVALTRTKDKLTIMEPNGAEAVRFAKQ